MHGLLFILSGILLAVGLVEFTTDDTGSHWRVTMVVVIGFAAMIIGAYLI